MKNNTNKVESIINEPTESIADNSNAIIINNLTKYYGNTRGVENISFTVKKGTIHGFLGPNGAGKTTTIRLLVGLLKPTNGNAQIFDYAIGSVESKQIIGYLPSDYELYKHYRVGEYLDYIAKLRGEAPLLEDLVTIFDVDLSRKTKELSKGNRQKVNIVQALMHDPELLIADEPTAGLDPLMQEEFDKIIHKFIQRGKTAFISSHILTEVQNICDIVTVIKDGEIVNTGKIEELLKEIPRKAILKKVNKDSLTKIAEDLHVNVSEESSEKIIVYFNYPIKEFIKKLSNLDYIEDFTIPEPSLEEYFLPLYRK